jgi:WhiB family transcriptional regulator, redox-sensing transcriptional regulator
MTLPTWMEDAPCLGTPTDAFFPNSDNHITPDAARLCRTCPHQPDCLNYAIDNGIWHGIWGGHSPTQRQDIARGRRQPRHGSIAGYTTDRCRCHLCRTEMTEYDRSKRPRKTATA